MLPAGSIERADPLAVRRALSRIADALSVPVVALYDSALMPAEIGGAAELIDLYLALKSDSARTQVLGAARSAVATQSD